ncbi:MAG TPA: hypothetical protein VM686_10420 [Polyangiaceae bacterium]|nr:hypothetical protein [Polyangiaceae bacterium]
MIHRRLVSVAAALAFSLSAQIACAEDQFYKFDDELLDAKGLDSNAAVIKVRPPAARVTLIRPRASFVPELLKSIEQI